MEAMDSLNSGKDIREEMVNAIAQLPDASSSSGQFYSVLNESLRKLEGDPKFSILSHEKKSVSDAFAAIKAQNTSSEVNNFSWFMVMFLLSTINIYRPQHILCASYSVLKSKVCSTN